MAHIGLHHTDNVDKRSTQPGDNLVATRLSFRLGGSREGSGGQCTLMRAVHGHADGRRSCLPDTTLKNHVADGLNGTTPSARTGLNALVGMRTFGAFPGDNKGVNDPSRHDRDDNCAAVVLGKIVR